MTSLARIHSLFATKKSVVLSPKNVTRIGPDQARRAEKLVDRRITYALFGDIDVEDLLATSYMSLQIEDDDGRLVGVIIVKTYPNIPAIPPWEWKNWMTNLYGLTEVISRNTVWIHLLLWDPCYYFIFLKPLIHRLFQIRNFLQNILMVLPPGVNRVDFLNNLGTRVFPKDCTNPKSCQTLYLMQRQNFMSKYKIRRAVEEDNDDLVPLIETHSKRLQELYGSYYIAELLTRHKDSGRQIIVAEHNGVAVAVLCLNENVNYKVGLCKYYLILQKATSERLYSLGGSLQLSNQTPEWLLLGQFPPTSTELTSLPVKIKTVLNEEFELTPYNGLKKPHTDDVDLALDGLYPSLEPLPCTTSEEEVIQIVERRSLESTTGGFSDEEVLIHISSTSSDDYSLVFTSGSIFVFQDDDDKAEGSTDSIDDLDLLSELGEVLRKDLKLPDLESLSMYSEAGRIKSLPKLPKFLGEANAFCVELAAAHTEHEYGLLMLFESAFKCFPDRDYSIISIPATVHVNKLINTFGRVIPRSSGTFPRELYLLHRNASLGLIYVTTATREHEVQVRNLLLTIPNNYLILQQYDNYLNDQKSLYDAFVMMCETQVVGIAILSEEFDVDYLQTHYDLLNCAHIKLFKTGCHGLIESLVLSPIYQIHSNYFLRELHRLSDYSVLYYKHSPYDSTHQYRERPLVNLLQILLPVIPRYHPNYDLDVLKEEECELPAVVTEKKNAYALYLSTMPHCSVNRYVVNTKIIVIGSSHTSLAFLQSLLLTQNPKYMVTFNNVTLIGQYGVNHLRVGSRIQEAFMLKKYFVDSRHMDSISLRTYVNYVQGRLTKINRKEQYVVVNDVAYEPYDLLFLMSGETFLMPHINGKACIEDPENVFVINYSFDARGAVLKLKQLYNANKTNDYLIIVYGHFLQAYCTLHGLLSYGIPGSNLVFIEPFPYCPILEPRHRHDVSIFNNPEVDEVVHEQIKAQGIQIYSSYYFVGWEYDEDEKIITLARFESSHKMLELECMAMFFFNERSITPRIYRVINDAGLVFDGRLVIDSKCRTNDPNIYGAGTLTKYSRKYYANHMMHKYFNRMEIGYQLGQQVKEMLLPPKILQKTKPKASWNFDLERGDSLVPRYEKPIMRYCRLPGGLYYLSVVKPGRKVPLETARNMDNYGLVLITGSCKDLSKQGFFRLHLNKFKRVETITCLSKSPIDIRNIYNLWGKHERLLNNLQLRFEMGVITDFFEYFKEPWAYAIYHDRFEYLVEELNAVMTSISGFSEDALIVELIDMYKENKWKELTEDQRDTIEEKFTMLCHPQIIEHKVLDFIQRNLDHLPMYAHPTIVKILLAGYKKSPMFSK